MTHRIEHSVERSFLTVIEFSGRKLLSSGRIPADSLPDLKISVL